MLVPHDVQRDFLSKNGEAQLNRLKTSDEKNGRTELDAVLQQSKFDRAVMVDEAFGLQNTAKQTIDRIAKLLHQARDSKNRPEIALLLGGNGL